MEFILMFEDGSSACLEHYGVKGMKWGKWNPETRARYAGAGNGTYYKKAKHGSEYGQSVTNLRRAYNANQPKSKQVAKMLLLSPGGAHAYNTARSRGLSRSDALQNAGLGVFYAQGVKHKQKKLGTTEARVSQAAKERADYTKSESLKKTAVKTVLMGTSGQTVYNTVKARTKSRGKAAVAAVFTNVAVVGTATAAQLGGAAVAGPIGQTVASIPASYTGYGAYTATRVGGNKTQVKANSFETRKPKK